MNKSFSSLVLVFVSVSVSSTKIKQSFIIFVIAIVVADKKTLQAILWYSDILQSQYPLPMDRVTRLLYGVTVELRVTLQP